MIPYRVSKMDFLKVLGRRLQAVQKGAARKWMGATEMHADPHVWAWPQQRRQNSQGTLERSKSGEARTK